MILRLESRPHKLRRALIALAVLTVLGVGLNYTVWFDRFWFKVPAGGGPVRAFQNDGRPDVAMLHLPTLGKEVPIVFTTSTDNRQIHQDLDRGVSLAAGNARPGEAGNVFLTGHSSNWPWTGPYHAIFSNLDRLKPGDEIFIDWDRRYRYRVLSQRVVSPSDISVLTNDTTKHQLTLMTCWPPPTTFGRRIVVAELVP